MSKKVYIGVGHGGSDSGAVGNGFKEKNLNLDIAKACMNYLKANGVDVKISRTTDVDSTINSKVREANSWGANLVIEIHNNSGGGDGAEVYYSRVGGMSKTLAQNVLNEICKLGQQSRGIKTKLGSSGRDYFGMVRDTDAPAIFVECAFIDTKDVQIVDTLAERVAMGEAIAKGALTTLGIKASTPASKPAATNTASNFKSYLAKVTASALNIRKGPGTNNDIVGCIRDRGTYTIVAESSGNGSKKGWGKLKSGAGWISLDYVKKI